MIVFKFRVFPADDEELVKKMSDSVFVFTTDPDTGVLAGYGIDDTQEVQCGLYK